MKGTSRYSWRALLKNKVKTERVGTFLSGVINPSDFLREITPFPPFTVPLCRIENLFKTKVKQKKTIKKEFF